MAYLIDLKSFTDKRGNLTVIEKTLPFEIKRIFYIYGVDDSDRGGHRHKKPSRQLSASRVAVPSVTATAKHPVLKNLYSPGPTSA